MSGDASGNTEPVELHSMTPCQANLALKANRGGPGGGEAGERGANGGATVNGNGRDTDTAFCSCDRDPRFSSNCALFRTEGGAASILDSKPLPEGVTICDRATCSALFLKDHAKHCPVYYQGAPDVRASK